MYRRRKVQKAKKWTVHCATNKQAVECCAVYIVRIAMSVVWPPSLEVGSSHLWCGLIAKLESRLQGFATIPPRHWLHHPWERERESLASILLSKFPPRQILCDSWPPQNRSPFLFVKDIFFKWSNILQRCCHVTTSCCGLSHSPASGSGLVVKQEVFFFCETTILIFASSVLKGLT